MKQIGYDGLCGECADLVRWFFDEFIGRLLEEQFVLVDHYVFHSPLPRSLDYQHFPGKLFERDLLAPHDGLDYFLIRVCSPCENGDIIRHCLEDAHVYAAQVLLECLRVRLQAAPLAGDRPTASQLRSQETHVKQLRHYFVVLGEGGL